MKTHWTLFVVAGVCLAGLLTRVPAADAAMFTLVDQYRYVEACGWDAEVINTFGSSISAQDAGPFNRFAEAMDPSVAGVYAAASQSSTIGPWKLQACMDCTDSTDYSVNNGAASAESVYQVTFQLNETTEAFLTGDLSDGTARLTDLSDDSSVFSFNDSYCILDDVFTLHPGDYELYVGVFAGGMDDGGHAEVELTIVPEPATMSLLALGGLAMLRRRRKK